MAPPARCWSPLCRRATLRLVARAVRRVDSPWTPATPTEGYEIVRRRLFEPITEQDAIAARAATVKAFQDMYSKNVADFPNGCGERAYAELMTSCYPVEQRKAYTEMRSCSWLQRRRASPT